MRIVAYHLLSCKKAQPVMADWLVHAFTQKPEPSIRAGFTSATN
jgi:hypothetical protein